VEEVGGEGDEHTSPPRGLPRPPSGGGGGGGGGGAYAYLA